MRAYVLQGINYTHIGKHDIAEPEVIGIASSKKHAMEACKHWLNGVEDSGDVIWENTEKHSGHAKKKEFVATYKMFFINQLVE